MESKYADDDLTELVQAAFDKYLLDKIPAIMESKDAEIEQRIFERIRRSADPKLNTEIFNRVESIVETTVGNYLRVGNGRHIIDSAIFKYLDKELEKQVENKVQQRVNRMMDKFKKEIENDTIKGS